MIVFSHIRVTATKVSSGESARMKWVQLARRYGVPEREGVGSPVCHNLIAEEWCAMIDPPFGEKHGLK